MEFIRPFISDEEGAKLREEFIKIYNELILPAFKGADRLLEWIEQSDFFESPASTMYHLSCKYGLLKHSLNVYRRLVKLVNDEYGKDFEKHLGVNNAELAIIALLHDLCKANTYTVEMRNVKDETGTWVREPYFKYNAAFEYGHGEKSVFIIQNFIQGLSLNVCLAIRYHQLESGSPGTNEKDSNALKMCETFPIILFTGVADRYATYLDEAREEKK